MWTTGPFHLISTPPIDESLFTWPLQKIISGVTPFRNKHLFLDTLRNSIIFVLYPSENMAMLFFPFRKEVVQYSSKEKLYSPYLYWWCGSPFIPSEIYSWYLHPSEIDISDNNPLQKNHSPSIDPFRKSHKQPLQKISSIRGVWI